MNNKERFLKYLQTCVKSTRATENNPLLLGGNAPKDYARFLESALLFDYDPSKWVQMGSMYDINDYSKALEIFNELIADDDFLKRDRTNNQGWRRGAISHYVCFLRAQEFFKSYEGCASCNSSEGQITLPLQTISQLPPAEVLSKYAQYLTAIRTKPFVLLAGISGTGKSRIVRELARSCYETTSDEYKMQVPPNFCMIQVKPNWHDSSELIGYVSRINGEKFITGPFLHFVAKAWENPDMPHFLCLDEMNLAPVEQYFAEYLSVVESRKVNSETGTIETDSILQKDKNDWYRVLTAELTANDELRKRFLEQGISLPQNLIVVGTVNMDETTYSFSRKVLDRAMTIEMNEVDLNGGLQKNVTELGHIDSNCFKPLYVEGCDVYNDHKDLCDQVIEYLTEVNKILEGTPFKIAYRTRNEFLVYAVNRQMLACEGTDTLSNALDEMTSMKILSRIEGDADRTASVLAALQEKLQSRFGGMEKSISLGKISEMLGKLEKTQYTSFWS